MKNFLLKIALFFAFMVVIDVVCGWAFSELRAKAKSGQTYKNEYINTTCAADVLILGSSRADHHYVPKVFEDSLGMSCYNAGQMGCGIIPAYVRYKLVSERKKPKLVLYEVTPGADYLQTDLYSRYIGTIRAYTDNPMVKQVYLDFSDDELEPLRLLSSLYRNNSKITDYLKDILSSSRDEDGYIPLNGTIKAGSVDSQKNKESRQVDELKLSYLIKLLEQVKKDNVPFIMIVSPTYDGKQDLEEYALSFDISEKMGIPMINNYSNASFVGRKEYFQDNNHLNHTGAVAYTKYVVSQVKDFLK